MAIQLKTKSQQAGMRLRLTCATRGVSLSEFAREAKISRGALGRFLEGKPVAGGTAVAIGRAAFAMLNGAE